MLITTHGRCRGGFVAQRAVTLSITRRAALSGHLQRVTASVSEPLSPAYKKPLHHSSITAGSILMGYIDFHTSLPVQVPRTSKSVIRPLFPGARRCRTEL